MRNIFVVIPVYNSKRFLLKTIESIKKQKEIINKVVIIDDGSNDGSEVICDELQKDWDLRHVIHQNNSGAAKARNVGIDYILSICKDKKRAYIAFLDSDDYWNMDISLSSFEDKNADIVAFLYRDDYYTKKVEYQDGSSKSEFIVAKHRNGATKTIPLLFRKAISKFETFISEESGEV